MEYQQRKEGFSCVYYDHRWGHFRKGDRSDKVTLEQKLRDEEMGEPYKHMSVLGRTVRRP